MTTTFEVPLPDLSDKVVMVTGAGSPIGLGHAMAVDLLRCGAAVALLDANGESLAGVSSELIARFGRNRALGITADITSPEDVQRAEAQATDAFGRIDILINNAGIFHRSRSASPSASPPPDRFWEIPTDMWMRTVSVNFTGAFLMTRAVIDGMRARKWGRIIGVTTSLDSMWTQGAAPYGPSKAGHEALVAVMARDLEGSGVTANILIPGGPTYTGMTAGVPEFGSGAMIAADVMAGPVRWLVSDDSASWTGKRLVARLWDETLPLPARLERAGAPAAWPQLGRQAAPSVAIASKPAQD